jgi:hypothetical protein
MRLQAVDQAYFGNLRFRLDEVHRAAALDELFGCVLPRDEARSSHAAMKCNDVDCVQLLDVPSSRAHVERV